MPAGDQKRAASVIFSEAFWEPLTRLNALRALAGLAPLVEHDFNRYIKQETDAKPSCSGWGLQFERDRLFIRLLHRFAFPAGDRRPIIKILKDTPIRSTKTFTRLERKVFRREFRDTAGVCDYQIDGALFENLKYLQAAPGAACFFTAFYSVWNLLKAHQHIVAVLPTYHKMYSV